MIGGQKANRCCLHLLLSATAICGIAKTLWEDVANWWLHIFEFYMYIFIYKYIYILSIYFYLFIFLYFLFIRTNLEQIWLSGPEPLVIPASTRILLPGARAGYWLAFAGCPSFADGDQELGRRSMMLRQRSYALRPTLAANRRFGAGVLWPTKSDGFFFSSK